MSGLYEKWKQNLLTAATDSDLDGTGSTGVYAALVDKDTGYTPNYTTDQFYSTVSANIVGTPVELSNKTFTNGVFDADDVVFSSVSGNSVEGVLIYRQNGGANTTWQLVAFIDDVTPSSVTPNTGDISVTWNASGIFKL